MLIVDCDPQANLSEAFGWAEELPGERLEDLLANPDAAGRLHPAGGAAAGRRAGLEWRERLRIIPSTDALADVAADLPVTGGPGYELRLREVLEPLRERFDVMLLDTPPGLGTLSGMAVLAADGLLIPALAADLDVRGAGKLYDLVEGEIPELRILGVLLAASERRWRVTRDATDRMTADEMRVLPVQVPRAVRVASAPRHRRADRGARAGLDGQPRLPAARPSPPRRARAMSEAQPMPSVATAADPGHGQPTDRSPAAEPAPVEADHARRRCRRGRARGARPRRRRSPKATTWRRSARTDAAAQHGSL